MSMNEDNNHTPEPDEKLLSEALKNKDDIPILMDVIADELKARVSQEDYFANAIADPIPVLSDVTELDVESALGEGEFQKEVKQTSVARESEAEPQTPTVATTVNEVESDKIESEEIISSHRELDDQVLSDEIPTITDSVIDNTKAESNDSLTSPSTEKSTLENHKVSTLQEHLDTEGFNEVPDVIVLPNETAGEIEKAATLSTDKDDLVDSDTQTPPKAALPEQASANSSGISMVHTTTFNKDDLQKAIEKAFTTLLPDLMELVLQELSKPDKKDG